MLVSISSGRGNVVNQRANKRVFWFVNQERLFCPHLRADSDWALADAVFISHPSIIVLCQTKLHTSHLFLNRLLYCRAAGPHNIRLLNVLIYSVRWWMNALHLRHCWRNYLLKWSNIWQWMWSILIAYVKNRPAALAIHPLHQINNDMSKTTTCWDILINQHLYTKAKSLYSHHVFIFSSS